MFYDIANYPFLEAIRQHTDVIAAEFEKQREAALMKEFMGNDVHALNSHTQYWVKEGGFDETQIGYDLREGTWASFPLYKKGFPIKWYDVEESFPETYKDVLTVPDLNFSAFFRISPASGSKEHVHTVSNLIFHLCLTDLDGDSVMRCGGEEKILKRKGDWCLFNYSNPHSSYNHSNQERVNLIIDFNVPA